MGGCDTSFAAYLKNAWDMQFPQHPRVIFVVAGSVSAWIQDNILQSKAFVGRISLDVTLSELPLSDCRAFWGRKAERTALREIIDVLSVTGGVPKYLQEIDPSLPADENVKRMCFTPEGYLFKDFNTVFGDVFGAAAAKRRILVALAGGSASVSELAERFGQEPNGHLSEDLRDLIAGGFVASSGGKNPNIHHYREEPVEGKQVRQVHHAQRQASDWESRHPGGGSPHPPPCRHHARRRTRFRDDKKSVIFAELGMGAASYDMGGRCGNQINPWLVAAKRLW